VITFRASYSGNCIKGIVQMGLHPQPETFDPFLHAGHTLQQTVIQFLIENNIKLLTADLPNEMEGKYTHGDRWRLVGHVDGILSAPVGILEVKAIKDESFTKLLDTSDWRGMYGQYVSQSQAYMGFKEYTGEGSSVKLSGPMGKCFFVFYNRNNGNIISPFPISHTKHTARQDLIEYRSPDIHQQIINKFDTAYDYIQKKELPECDYPGYCFFCERYNSHSTTPGAGRTLILDGNKNKELANLVTEYRQAKRNVKKLLMLGDTILDTLESMGAETVQLKFKGKRNMNIKKWEFQGGGN